MNKLVRRTTLLCCKAFRALSFIFIVFGVAASVLVTGYISVQIWTHMHGVILVMSDSLRGVLMITMIIATTPVAVGALGVLGADSIITKLKMA